MIHAAKPFRKLVPDLLHRREYSALTGTIDGCIRFAQ